MYYHWGIFFQNWNLFLRHCFKPTKYIIPMAMSFSKYRRFHNFLSILGLNISWNYKLTCLLSRVLTWQSFWSQFQKILYFNFQSKKIVSSTISYVFSVKTLLFCPILIDSQHTRLKSSPNCSEPSTTKTRKELSHQYFNYVLSTCIICIILWIS